MPLILAIVLLSAARFAGAQTAAGPAIVNRTANDSVTVRAVRVDAPLRWTT